MKIAHVPADGLIIHSGALGDVICTLPAIRYLSAGLTFDFCCQKHISPVIRLFPTIQNVIDIQHPSMTSVFMTEMDNQTKKWFSSYAFILLFSFSNDWETRFQRIHPRVYRISPRPPKEQLIHTSEFILVSLKNNHLLSPDIRLLNDLILQKKTNCYKNTSTSLVLIHPGSGSAFKNWPFDCFFSLAKKLRQKGHSVKWLIGPSEDHQLHQLYHYGESIDNVLQTDQVKAIMDIFDFARYYIGNDSGISHLAALMGMDSTIIFGPSDARRWKPMGPKVNVIPEKPFCPPCFETSNRHCTHRNCFNEVSVENVLDSIFQKRTHR